MTLINRTIYPQYDKPMNKLHLEQYFTPTRKEVNWAHNCARGETNICTFLVNLKILQNFSYFIPSKDIPQKIIKHIKSKLGINRDVDIKFSDRSVRRQKNEIRTYLNKVYDIRFVRELVSKSVVEYEPIMENSADVFNAVLEKLVKNNCELPSFSMIDRWIKSKQTKINNDLFKYVSDNLSESEKQILDEILEPTDETFTKLNYIKELPKSPSLSHIKTVMDNYIYLRNLNIGQNLIGIIHSSKINNFSSQVNVLDASEVKDFSQDKRYTLMICFIYKSLIKTGDDLITMFIKRLGKIHNRGKNNLEKLLEKQRSKTENAINVFHSLLTTSKNWNEPEFATKFNSVIEQNGGYDSLLSDCEEIAAFHNNNYYPLLPKSLRSHRSILFEIIKLIDIKPGNKDNSLMKAIEYLLSCENRRSDFIDANVDLSFTSEKWKKFVVTREDNREVFIRKHFEICVFSCIASDFKTGDLCVKLSDEYADYREQLLPWGECKAMLDDYCSEMSFPSNSKDFTQSLKSQLDLKAKEVDRNYPDNSEILIYENGEIVLKKTASTRNIAKIKEFKKLFESKMPERNIMEILCSVEKLSNYTKHFGPLSGSDAKITDARSRYVLLAFGYGSNLGPAQTSKHVKGSITAREIQFTNQRHVTAKKLDKAICDIVNDFNKLSLPTLWGDVNTVAADGTKLDLYSENLLSEYHIRYGGYGGIAYHHVSDRYIALFSHFIPCGVWEAVYIIDGLLKNKSDIQPDTIHADTQGQSATVFALTHLLGIKLMPRIRNWKDLKFYRPYKDSSYKHIDSLFKDTVRWDIIETHYEDLFQVILSIKSGKILPSTLLRKLNNYSRKNKLFQAFRELGIVVRTIYLLDFISDLELRDKITESTNKTESYNAFSKWFFFGGEGVIRENSLDDQTKVIKYNELLANAVILQNTIDMGSTIKRLKDGGVEVTKQDIKNLSPYLTSHIKRFGEYIIDLDSKSEPIVNLDLDKFLK